MPRFIRSTQENEETHGVRGLLERLPTVRELGAAAAADRLFALDPELEWVTVVDAAKRPVSLARRPQGHQRKPTPAPVIPVDPDQGAAEVATRAMARPPDHRLVPFVRCDNQGRYVALLRVERVVEELADLADEPGQTERYARGSHVRGSPRIVHAAGP